MAFVALSNKTLEDLLLLWDEKREGREMPSRADLPLTVLRPWLGYLAVIDLTGARPYFRLSGTNLLHRFGREMTGTRVDILDDEHGHVPVQSMIDSVRTSQSPMRILWEVPYPGGIRTYHDLYAPLSHNGHEADTVLFASYPETES